MDANETTQLRMMEWAKELQTASEVRSPKPKSRKPKARWKDLSTLNYDQKPTSAKEILCCHGNVSVFLCVCVLQSCGVQSEELGKVLRLLGLKKKRLVNLLPLLEFITWSLLKEDSTVREKIISKFLL